jgi:hypothetical protein
VVHHDAEISDYLEKQYGYRTDGKKTAQQQKWDEEYKQRQKEKADLKERDLDEYYRQYPWEKPLTDEEKAKAEREQEKQDKEWERKQRRRSSRSYSYKEQRPMTQEEYRKHVQGKEAKASGTVAGGSINLEPFVQGGEARKQVG